MGQATDSKFLQNQNQRPSKPFTRAFDVYRLYGVNVINFVQLFLIFGHCALGVARPRLTASLQDRGIGQLRFRTKLRLREAARQPAAVYRM